MEIEQEKFEAIKELATIGTNIGLGRAELEQLKKDTEGYLQLRETEAEGRVQRVLNESREALDETSKYQNELRSYGRELMAFANSLKGLSSHIVALFKDFRSRLDVADADLTKRELEIKEVLKQVKIERVQVTEDRKQLGREQSAINDEKKLLRDRQGLLAAGWEELKNKSQ